MPRDELAVLLAEIERLGLMNEARAILHYLVKINRIIESVRIRTTVNAFAPTVGAENQTS